MTSKQHYPTRVMRCRKKVERRIRNLKILAIFAFLAFLVLLSTNDQAAAQSGCLKPGSDTPVPCQLSRNETILIEVPFTDPARVGRHARDNIPAITKKLKLSLERYSHDTNPSSADRYELLIKIKDPIDKNAPKTAWGSHLGLKLSEPGSIKLAVREEDAYFNARKSLAWCNMAWKEGKVVDLPTSTKLYNPDAKIDQNKKAVMELIAGGHPGIGIFYSVWSVLWNWAQSSETLDWTKTTCVPIGDPNKPEGDLRNNDQYSAEYSVFQNDRSYDFQYMAWDRLDLSAIGYQISYNFDIYLEDPVKTTPLFIRVVIPYRRKYAHKTLKHRYLEIEWRVELKGAESSPEPDNPWIKVFLSGDAVKAHLSQATSDMGALKAGGTYTVVYVPETKEFKVTGPAVTHGGATLTRRYSNADLFKSQISLWGRKFEFDSSGRLYDIHSGGRELVGILQMPLIY